MHKVHYCCADSALRAPVSGLLTGILCNLAVLESSVCYGWHVMALLTMGLGKIYLVIKREKCDICIDINVLRILSGLHFLVLLLSVWAM